MEKQIRDWFAKNYQDCTNWTEAAQICADELGHIEWLDQPEHILWDNAIEFFD